MELLVYYDESYPVWWISRAVSKRIVSFLKDKSFLECDAEELAKRMEKLVDDGRCHESVVVFSQDVAPETVCQWVSPSSLFRTYLDCGGTAVWMGDSPFYYRGRRPQSTPEFKKWYEQRMKEDKLREDPDGGVAEVFGRDGPFEVLGVMPVYVDFPSAKAHLTLHGERLGLRGSWYGLRPILVTASDRRKKRITVLATGAKPERPVSRKKVWAVKDKEESGILLQNLLGGLGKLIGLAPALITLVSAFYTFSAGFNPVIPLAFLAASAAFGVLYASYWVLRSREILASGWIRNYDSNHHGTGFLRIWDCHLDRISDEKLAELFSVIEARAGLGQPQR